jgi:hypothetical protein
VLTALDPIPDGPRQPARFYAYDDVDAMYAARPQFNWVELRGSGTRLDMSDDETQVISLPAGFGPWRYYGQSFAQISICSNGWVAPGSTTSSSYTNEALPSATAPCMVAADWDDLYPPEGGGVWYWHDAANHRFIVEWESMPYYSNRTTFDQFEIVIYDTTVHSRAGDNVIDMQYLAAAGFGSNTVGLQDPGLTIGIQCLFDGAYHRAAAPIGPGRCIRFTTDSAVVGVADRSAAGVQLRPGLALARNPFSRGALLRATTPEPGARVTVYDASGRAVRVLAQGLGSGVHELVWDGLDQRGRSVANGVYLLRLDAGAGSVEQKAVLIR